MATTSPSHETYTPKTYIFFHRPQDTHGIYSQWFPASFPARLSSVYDALGIPFSPPDGLVEGILATTSTTLTTSTLTPTSTTTTTTTTTTPTTTAPTATSSSNDDNDNDDNDNTNNPLITFPHAEQFMMLAKAILSADVPSALLILATPDPRAHRHLGRLVHPFNPEAWDARRYAVVRAGNLLKFGQNGGLRRRMLATGEDAEFVEASVGDRVWGIGFSAGQAPGREEEWGENLLGKVLVEVRALLREEEGDKGGYERRGRRSRG